MGAGIAGHQSLLGGTGAGGYFYEPFNEGLAPYSVDVGAADSFSIVAGYDGNGLLMEPGPNAADAIRRDFTLQWLSTIRFRFKVTNITADDYGVMHLRGLAGTELFGFDCGRQAIADSLRRPMFRLTGQAGAPENRIGAGSVTADRWYVVVGEYDLNALTFTLTITDTTDSSVFGSATVSVSDNIAVSRVVWITDNAGGTVIWDELLLEFEA